MPKDNKLIELDEEQLKQVSGGKENGKNPGETTNPLDVKAELVVSDCSK